MYKTALITGGTDGIGRATAIELAKSDYTVHVLGRNEKRGQETLEELKKINSEAEHKFYNCDLSTKKNVNEFLDKYLAEQNRLDVLVLNAGVFPKKTILSEDGIDLSFSVGYVSRYLFSVRLNSLLQKSKNGQVIHVCGSVMGNVKLDKLENPTYGKMTSVWQNSVGSALLAYHWQDLSETKVLHSHWNPGVVNTQTVKSQSAVIRFLSGLAGMVEPWEAGKMIADYINTKKGESAHGIFVSKGKISKPKKGIVQKKGLRELLRFSEQFTGVGLPAEKISA